jgi:probable F420-dependent oxidoreductase
MRVGPLLRNSGQPSRENMFAVARAAEALGYDSLWATTHTAIPVQFESRYPYSPTGRPSWDAKTPWGDAFVSLAFVAAVTERVRLGTSVIPLTITDPLTLAKQAATLDAYSGGRLEIGIGAGWLVEEGQALGRPTDHRSARLEEAVEILRLAWSRDTFSYEGRFWSFPEVGVNPKPQQGKELPIWIGGQGQRAVEIAARHGCGLMLWFAEPDAVRGYHTRLRAAGGTGPVAAAMPMDPNAGRWSQLTEEYVNAGTDLLILTTYGQNGSVTAELEQFSAEVLPEVKERDAFISSQPRPDLGAMPPVIADPNDS